MAHKLCVHIICLCFLALFIFNFMAPLDSLQRHTIIFVHEIFSYFAWLYWSHGYNDDFTFEQHFFVSIDYIHEMGFLLYLLEYGKHCRMKGNLRRINCLATNIFTQLPKLRMFYLKVQKKTFKNEHDYSEKHSPKFFSNDEVSNFIVVSLFYYFSDFVSFLLFLLYINYALNCYSCHIN